LLAKIGVDTAENEPLKVHLISTYGIQFSPNRPALLAAPDRLSLAADFFTQAPLLTGGSLWAVGCWLWAKQRDQQQDQQLAENCDLSYWVAVMLPSQNFRAESPQFAIKSPGNWIRGCLTNFMVFVASSSFSICTSRKLWWFSFLLWLFASSGLDRRSILYACGPSPPTGGGTRSHVKP